MFIQWAWTRFKKYSNIHTKGSDQVQQSFKYSFSRLVSGIIDIRIFVQTNTRINRCSKIHTVDLNHVQTIVGKKKKPNLPLTGHHHWVGEETEEEAADRLSLRQLEEPQLLGVQILLLRVPRHPQRSRCVVFLSFDTIFFILNVVGACETYKISQHFLLEIVFLDLYI